MSSHVSSCTKPTWLASMKHGSHIMLQRLVRSTVSTEPRPCLIVLLPWLWSFSSLWARMSRPGNTSSRCLKNAVSIAITSSKCPWIGQSLIMTILPSFSSMVALISPTFSLSRVSSGRVPSRIAWRASRTQVGHSESVWRGQPSGGLVFWYDFSSGLSDHFGVHRRVRTDLVELRKHLPDAVGGDGQTLFGVFNRRVHGAAPRMSGLPPSIRLESNHADSSGIRVSS